MPPTAPFFDTTSFRNDAARPLSRSVPSGNRMSSTSWPEGLQGAVSISYDHGLPCHHEAVAPAWETHGLRVTFYTCHQPDAHPRCLPRCCRKEPWAGQPQHLPPVPEEQDWLPAEYDLRRYTPRRWTDDANRERHPAVPRRKGKPISGMGSQPGAADQGTVRRRPGPFELPDRRSRDHRLQRPGALQRRRPGFRHPAAEIAAAASGGWIIHMTHGVGESTHSLFTDPSVHQPLVE